MPTETLTTDFDCGRPAGSRRRGRAYAVKGWAVIVLGRLQDGKPMDAAARDVASSICSELKAAAAELQRDADKLGGLMSVTHKEPWQARRGSIHLSRE